MSEMLMPNSQGKQVAVSDKDFLVYLNNIIACMVQEGYLLQLKGTPIYRHNVKFHCNKLRNELAQEMSTTVDALGAADMSSLVTINENLDQLIPLFCKLKPEDIPYIRAIFQAFIMDRERMVPLVTAHLGSFLK